MAETYACSAVIDLELTPVSKGMRGRTGLCYEIIEASAIKVAAGGNVAGEFPHMVKPEFVQGALAARLPITSKDG